jgi:hypothetical protein
MTDHPPETTAPRFAELSPSNRKPITAHTQNAPQPEAPWNP